MKIEHIAIWVHDLEGMKAFYETHFAMKSGMKYHNSKNRFTSYFLSFEEGPRIELMNIADLGVRQNKIAGLAHFALSLGSIEKVDALTAQFKSAGITVVSGPRVTGDGYYESVISDPEGNLIELTI